MLDENRLYFFDRRIKGRSRFAEFDQRDGGEVSDIALYLIHFPHKGSANAHKVMEMARGYLRKSKFAVAFCVAVLHDGA